MKSDWSDKANPVVRHLASMFCPVEPVVFNIPMDERIEELRDNRAHTHRVHG